jgi:pantetheine-phosphate adenylyltransferase
VSVSAAAIYPGSFDPVTFGHLDIIARASALFPRLVVAVVGNPSKRPMFRAEERVALIEAEVASFAALADGPEQQRDRTVEVIAFDGLLVDLCAELGVTTVVKGLRGVGDLEIELRMAQMNLQIGAVETVFLGTAPEHSHLASSFVREIAGFGGRLDRAVPPAVERALRERAQADRA